MTKANEPAFPPMHNPENHVFGLTKREYFAAMALQGLCVPSFPDFSNRNDSPEAEFKAEMAVRLADALIAELDRKPHD